ncbi:MAG: DUF4402 domain-containing protein [Geothrix sp.]|nr:DUF4402 domain-containing protein [Geothrix sp.]
MIPLLYPKAMRPCRFAGLAGIAVGVAAQTPQTMQVIQAIPSPQNTLSITKYTDINVGSVVARPFSGVIVLNSASGSPMAKGGVSLGRFTLTGKKGDGWSLATGSAVPFILTGPKGGTLRVTAVNFDPSTPTTGTFPASGTTSEFSVGVTLAASARATPSGTYTGGFTLNATNTTTGRISTTTFIVRANFLTAISLSKVTDLNFGSAIMSGTAGTVVLTPTGARSATGGVTLASGGLVGPATFTVTGDAAATYAITLPSSITLNGAGGATLTVSPVASTPSATGLLDGTGQQTLAVGGTLNVAANQPAGAYSGTFNVTVAYN